MRDVVWIVRAISVPGAPLAVAVGPSYNSSITIAMTNKTVTMPLGK